MRSILIHVTAVCLTTAVALAAGKEASPGPPDVATPPALTFHDARQQATEFIGYFHSIRLSPDQERIKREALSAIRAPCCAAFTIATCCCPCNMAKAIWGLSHYLIARQVYDTPRVKEAVERWVRFTNPQGYSGDACFTGGCRRPFEKNGCGGMDEAHIL